MTPLETLSYDAASGCRLQDAQRTAFDCNKANCDKYCVCHANGCGAMLEHSDVQIDAALSNEGEELTGTFLVGNERIYVRMMRTP